MDSGDVTGRAELMGLTALTRIAGFSRVRRMSQVPVGGALVGVGYAQHRGLVERAAHDLESDWHALSA
jgi:hypothetical protein